MAEDIAPKLLEEIRKAVAKLESQNALIQAFREKSENKTAKLEDVHGYALGLGESASAALLDVIKSGVLPDDKLYDNIANRTVRPLLTDEINAVQDAAAEVQKIIDEKNGIGLNSVRADFPEDRVAGIIDKLDKSESIEEVRQYLGEPIVNLLEASFDSWVQTNAESRYKAGLESIVIRMAHNGACAWCRNLAGTYSYDNLDDRNIWRRHLYCRCVLIFQDSKSSYSPWTKKEWKTSPDVLERRRNAGNDLFRVTPELLEEINANLERDREVARLMRENPGLEKDRARYRVNRYGIASDLQRKVLDNLANNPEKLKMNVNILKRFLDENVPDQISQSETLMKEYTDFCERRRF